MNVTLLITSLFQIALAVVFGTIFAIMGNRDVLTFIAIFTALYMGTGFLGVRVATTALNKVPLIVFSLIHMIVFGAIIYSESISRKPSVGLITFASIHFFPCLINTICAPRSHEIDLSQKVNDCSNRCKWFWKALNGLAFNKHALDTFYTSLAALVFAAMMSMAVWCAKENSPVNGAWQNVPFACCYIVGLIFLVLFTILGWTKLVKEYYLSKSYLIIVNLLILLIISGITIRGLYLMFDGK